MKLINIAYGKQKKRTLKRSKTGMETEYHLLDSKGKISNRADEIITAVKGVKVNIDIVPEIGKNMIEFGCYPNVATYNPALDLLDSVEKASEICDSKGLWLYPFATYPGKFEPEMNKKESYTIKSKIFGKDRIKTACRATGFHHHYSLPKGVFDAEKKVLKILKKSKLKRTMVSSYNFEIAADPALTLFTQSSPFYQGKYLGKDSRVIVYRGGKKLKYMDGLYANLQQIGGLPPYKQTQTDLLTSFTKRWKRWESHIKKIDPKANINKLYPYELDIGWNPLKINKHGTLEQRGMDVNFMSILTAVTVLLKFSLKKIQREFIEVIPADFAIEEPFKLENGILYVPPHTYVRDKLQLWSAYEGYDNKDLCIYAKKLYNFAKSVTPKRYNKIIKPVSEMIESRKSMSDKILQYAKYKGYLKNGGINNSDAAQLALYYSKLFRKDIVDTKRELHRMSRF